jgi:hypothetical protein
VTEGGEALLDGRCGRLHQRIVSRAHGGADSLPPER